MEENEKRDLEQLAAEFERKLRATKLPDMDTVDLLDLMDYYTRSGKDFEADLCRYIAGRRDPNHPEVLLSEAHTYADMGNWPMALDYLQKSGAAGYDRMMFVVERYLRCGEVETAANLVEETLPKDRAYDMPDCDFIYDTAVLFRDYGFNDIAERLLSLLPRTYVDFLPATEIRVNCLIELKLYDQAKDLINALIDDRAFDQNLWMLMAWCCYHQGEYDEAWDAIGYAEAIAPVEDEGLKRLIALRRQGGNDAHGHYFEELLKSQDYAACLTYADMLYDKGHYRSALSAYQATGLLIPNGSREREHYLARCLLCLAYARRFDKDLVEYMHALHATGNDYWAVYLEAAQTFFETDDTNAALSILIYALSDRQIYGSRLTHIASILAHYNCYEPAHDLWLLLKMWRAHVAPSYRALIDEADRRLHLVEPPQEQ